MDIARFKPEARPATATGAQVVGPTARAPLAVAALAVGATAIGAFAIGRLSVGRLAVGRAKFGRVEIEELEVGRLTVREDPPDAGPPPMPENPAFPTLYVSGRAQSRKRSLLAGLLIGAAMAAAVIAAPAQALGPYPDLGSCQVFPDPPPSTAANAPSLPTQAAWNQDISKAPRDPRSAAYIAYINAHGGSRLHPDFGSPRPYGFPFAVVGPGQPLLPVNYTAYGEESDRGPFPVPAGAPVEGGNRSDGDRHVLAVDRADCTLYELYRAFYRPQPRPHWDADSGVSWDLDSFALRPEGWTSADAAGLPIFPGLVRYDEAAAGRVEHAIRVTFESTRDAYVHPAVHCAGDTANPSAPPMGLRLRLKAGYGLGGFSGPARTIAEAMKRYGLIVADNGSNWFFSGSSDRRWDDENLNQLKRIPGGAFEVVKSAAPVHAC